MPNMSLSDSRPDKSAATNKRLKKDKRVVAGRKIDERLEKWIYTLSMARGLGEWIFFNHLFLSFLSSGLGLKEKNCIQAFVYLILVIIIIIIPEDAEKKKSMKRETGKWELGTGKRKSENVMVH